MKKEIKDKELEQVSGGFVPEYETDNAGIGGGRGKACLTDEELEQVTGGIDEIKVQIKTLSGDNDEYVIPLTS